MNLAILSGELEVTDSPGISTLDPRFSVISEQIADGKHLEAAYQAQDLIADKAYDVRLISYFLYGHFMEEGIPGLKDIFQTLISLTSVNLEATGPVKKREDQSKTAYVWLLKQILKKIKYEETKNGECWTHWLEISNQDIVQDIVEAAEGFVKSASSGLLEKSGPVVDGTKQIVLWLKTFSKIVHTEVVEEETGLSEVEDVDTKPEETVLPAPPASIPDSLESRSLAEDQMTTAKGSVHLRELVARLEAFEKLIGQEKFVHAALLSDEINVIINNFDPRKYFPELFKDYYRIYATNIEMIDEAGAARETTAWNAMEAFCTVDLDGFVDS